MQYLPICPARRRRIALTCEHDGPFGGPHFGSNGCSPSVDPQGRLLGTLYRSDALRFGGKIFAPMTFVLGANGCGQVTARQLMDHCPWPISSCPAAQRASRGQSAPDELPVRRF